MNEVRFIYWKEYECPKCGRTLLQRVFGAEPHPEYPTQALYNCEGCGYEEYRDVSNSNN